MAAAARRRLASVRRGGALRLDPSLPCRVQEAARAEAAVHLRDELGGEVLMCVPDDLLTAEVPELELRTRRLVQLLPELAWRQAVADLQSREREKHLLELHLAVADGEPRERQATEQLQPRRRRVVAEGGDQAAQQQREVVRGDEVGGRRIVPRARVRRLSARSGTQRLVWTPRLPVPRLLKL